MRENYQVVIEPKTGLFDIPIKEVYQYRSMIFMLVKRNYQIQYKQTILGPLWMVLGPIFSSGLFSFIFGYVGNFDSDGIPYFLFYMTASIIWGFFSGCMGGNSRVFIDNAYLFGKVYFPRLVVPVSNIIFELIRFLIQGVVCVAVWLFFFVRGEAQFMGLYLLWIPVLVVFSGMFGMALGIIVSSLTTKYRDLSHFVGFGMQLLMYAAPVLYPMKQLPEKLQKLVLLNPMSSIIEMFRYCMTGSGEIHWYYLIYSAIVISIILIISVIMFNQTEKTFIDIV